jgi:hypothetical protein
MKVLKVAVVSVLASHDTGGLLRAMGEHLDLAPQRYALSRKLEITAVE